MKKNTPTFSPQWKASSELSAEYDEIIRLQGQRELTVRRVRDEMLRALRKAEALSPRLFNNPNVMITAALQTYRIIGDDLMRNAYTVTPSHISIMLGHAKQLLEGAMEYESLTDAFTESLRTIPRAAVKPSCRNLNDSYEEDEDDDDDDIDQIPDIVSIAMKEIKEICEERMASGHQGPFRGVIHVERGDDGKTFQFAHGNETSTQSSSSSNDHAPTPKKHVNISETSSLNDTRGRW